MSCDLLLILASVSVPVPVGLNWLFGSYLVNFGPSDQIFQQLQGFSVKFAY